MAPEPSMVPEPVIATSVVPRGQEINGATRPRPAAAASGLIFLHGQRHIRIGDAVLGEVVGGLDDRAGLQVQIHVAGQS